MLPKMDDSQPNAKRSRVKSQIPNKMSILLLSKFSCLSILNLFLSHEIIKTEIYMNVQNFYENGDL